MVRNVKSSLYQSSLSVLQQLRSERCEKIEFGSLISNLVLVIPLFRRNSTLFVKGYYTTWKRTFTKFYFFLFPVDLMLPLTLFCWKRAKIYEIFWLIRKPIPWIFFRFFSYVVIKMSENFNKFQENITRKARVNFHCKCYKLIKCKPSL